MKRTLLIWAGLAGLVLGASAQATGAPKWNSGYGWWPGGFGYPPLTVHASYPCSATAYGPTFNYKGAVWNQNYGASTRCARGVGTKTLTVYEQTLGADNHTWFTVSGSQVATGPTKSDPVRIKRKRAAYLGHAYRVVVVAKLVVPNGHAGCSITNTCNQTIAITVTSRPLAP
jgi:hypothetical protein